MLYPKKEQPFSMEEFQNPSCEYRGAPFWAWNCKLNENTLKKQAEIFRQMGFGGFHAHVRTGMDTPYLQEAFMNYIKLCDDAAREKDMLLWLYDEDRWPSGAAGGYVTRFPEFRERFLRLAPAPVKGFAADRQEFSSLFKAGQEPSGYLLARYRITLADGLLTSYKRLDSKEDSECDIWYVYLELSQVSAWYNNQTYVNTLDKAAIDKFIEVTHEAYYKALGSEFSKSVPAIFTDEPQFKTKQTFCYADEKREIILPFTDDFPDTFREAYGYDLLDRLPEIFWNTADYSSVRYHYHDHICNRFVNAFVRNIGTWCENHNIALTGHVNAEPTLTTQTFSVGSAMRCYPWFQLPGIDMLCDGHEFSTAKQAQSIVHQYGREGMLSELYGVTNWNYNFKGHKLHGDWQAALGVTIRVPHLSWMSMEGEAKRDYPASIFYQSPWYLEYPLIENHFARLNTALTRGICRVKVGVIHPIESFWLLWGPRQQCHDLSRQFEENFSNLITWLLFGLIDFDFIDEALLPELVSDSVPGVASELPASGIFGSSASCSDEGSISLSVGQMNYDAVILPPLLTIRGTTADILSRYAARGGTIISLGDAPTLCDTVPSRKSLNLWKETKNVAFDRYHLLSALAPYRDVDILNEIGLRTDNLLYQLRQDKEERWLFICHVYHRNNGYDQAEHIRIYISGNYRPLLYDTMKGSISVPDYTYESGKTVIRCSFYAHDSLLFRLLPENELHCESSFSSNMDELYSKVFSDCSNILCQTTESFQELPEPLSFSLSEPNVLLLDMAEYALNDEPLQAEEELLRLDNFIRNRLGYPLKLEHVAQPWVIQPHAGKKDTLTLRFTFCSDISYEGALLALEPQMEQKIFLNGQEVPLHFNGYFTDECIKTLPLPCLLSGKNELVLQMQYTEKTNVEWCYILGTFGVSVHGRHSRITKYPDNLFYGDAVAQGLAFYGANITYETELVSDGIHGIELFVPRFEGPLIRVFLDGNDIGPIAFAPHTIDLGCPAQGTHKLSLRLYGNRYNSFGCLHNTNTELTWFGPTCWRTEGNEWSYQYHLKPAGIMQNPKIRLYKKENAKNDFKLQA